MFHFLLGCTEWRRLNRHRSRELRPLWGVAAMLLLSLLAFGPDFLIDRWLGAHSGMPSTAMVNAWVHLLSQTLPAGAWNPIAAAALLVALPCWALEKQFREREITAQAARPTFGKLW